MSLQTIVVYITFPNEVLVIWLNVIIIRQMKCKTFVIFKSFQRVLYCTPNFFKYFKLDRNTPSIFRVQQASEKTIAFRYFYFNRFSIKLYIWKSNRFFFSSLGITPKNGPKSEQEVLKSVKRNDTKTETMQVLIELQQKLFPHQQPQIKEFWKYGANLTSDLMIFVYWSFLP